MIATLQNISFIKFSKLFNWDVKQYINTSSFFNKDIAVVFFKEFAQKAEIENVHIQDDLDYKILGVRSYGFGAFVNREVKGKTLKMRVYQKAKPNHLFWCKVDTKNGAFGIITNELANGIASSNMTFAELKTEKINPEYLQILFRSKAFNTYMDSFVTGTTNRKYIRPNQIFEEIKLPLPPLNDEDALKQNLPNTITQEKLVAAYNQKLKDAEDAKQKAINKEAEIETYLLNELGINKAKNTEAIGGLSFVKFKDLDRWDTLFLQSQTTKLQSTYPIIKFSKIIKCFNVDTNQKSLRFETYKKPNNEFYYLGMENVSRNSGRLIDLPIVKGSSVKSQTIKIPKDFIIYGKLRPYLNKYWHNTTDFENIVCSSEFFVFDIETSTIDKTFFIEVLASSIIQEQIKDKFSGVRMPRIGSDDFYNLYFPLPKEIAKQKNISKTINLKREEVKQQNELAELLKKQAIEDFEKIIFK